MVRSADLYHIVGWKQRVILGTPLPLARLGSSVVDNLQFLRPVDWERMEEQPPTDMTFTLSEFCNARCSFCGYKTSNPRHKMRNDHFCKAAKEYYAAGGRRIELNGNTGEPLLDPGFFEKVSYLRSLGDFDYIEFNTNGILLTGDEVVESVINSGITRLKISTAGFERSTYERIMGVKKYNDFLTGVCKLLQRDRELGYPLPIEFDIRGSMDKVDTPDFLEKILPYIDSSGGKITLSFLRFYYDWNGQVKAGELPENCLFRPRIRLRTRPCEGSFYLSVMANGDLRLCPANNPYDEDREDFLKVGSLDNDSVLDVWNSPTTKRVRRTTFGPGSNEVCRNCRWYRPI